MALSFVGSASNSAINGNDVTVTLPSMQEDDVVYVIGGSGNFGGGSVGISTTGYTTLDSATAGNCTAILGRKIQGATPDSSVVISGTGSSINGAAGAAHVWRGADTTTPEDATTIEVLGQGFVDSGSITTVTDGAEVLSLFADEDFDTTITAPSGYGNQDDAAASDSRSVTVGVASKNVASAGAEDPGTWSASFGASDDWAAYTVAIRPAAGGGGDEATGSASGSATVSGTGAATAESTASSSGVASVSGAGASEATTVGSAAGVATVSGVGLEGAPSESVGSSTGVATVSGIGAAEFAADFTSQGTATVAGVGDFATSVSAVGSASGVATVTGVGAQATIIQGVGSAAGTATVTGFLKPIWVAVNQGSEAWSDISKGSESWADVAKGSEAWSGVSKGSESWSDVPKGNETWS